TTGSALRSHRIIHIRYRHAHLQLPFSLFLRGLRVYVVFLMGRQPPRFTLFPYTTLFRSEEQDVIAALHVTAGREFPDQLGNSRRSEEHTSELQSPYDLVCRLLLEKKKITDSLSPTIMRNRLSQSIASAFVLTSICSK